MQHGLLSDGLLLSFLFVSGGKTASLQREHDNHRREYLKRLGLTFDEIWECQRKKWQTDNTNEDFLC